MWEVGLSVKDPVLPCHSRRLGMTCGAVLSMREKLAGTTRLSVIKIARVMLIPNSISA
ncbi:MAG: hypothetical protein NVSMB27_29140 [Ktedonobacteraceae bacterium]